VNGFAAVRASRVAPALPVAVQEPGALGVRRLLTLSALGARWAEGAPREGEPLVERFQGLELIAWRWRDAACLGVLRSSDDEEAIRERLQGETPSERHAP
jgi:hypothetical protein